MRGQSIHWSALFCNFINTRAYQLGWFKPSSPSTKGLHGCKNNRSFFYYIVWVAGAGTILFVNVDVASNTNVGHIGIGDANVGECVSAGFGFGVGACVRFVVDVAVVVVVVVLVLPLLLVRFVVVAAAAVVVVVDDVAAVVVAVVLSNNKMVNKGHSRSGQWPDWPTSSVCPTISGLLQFLTITNARVSDTCALERERERLFDL